LGILTGEETGGREGGTTGAEKHFSHRRKGKGEEGGGGVFTKITARKYLRVMKNYTRETKGKMH